MPCVPVVACILGESVMLSVASCCSSRDVLLQHSSVFHLVTHIAILDYSFHKVGNASGRHLSIALSLKSLCTTRLHVQFSDTPTAYLCLVQRFPLPQRSPRTPRKVILEPPIFLTVHDSPAEGNKHATSISNRG